MSEHIDPREFFGIDAEEYENTLLFGCPLTEYSREELMAALTHQVKEQEAMRDRHSRNLGVITGFSAGGGVDEVMKPVDYERLFGDQS